MRVVSSDIVVFSALVAATLRSYMHGEYQLQYPIFNKNGHFAKSYGMS
jgi:hypothetical protein